MKSGKSTKSITRYTNGDQMSECYMTDCQDPIHDHFLCVDHYQNALECGAVSLEPTRQQRSHNRMFSEGRKMRAMRRDGFRCRYCGLTRMRHLMLYDREMGVHHVDNKGSAVIKKDRNNSLDNLVTICASCHPKLHAGTLEEYDGYTIKIQ